MAVMNEKEFREIFPNVRVTKTKKRLKTYTGETVRPVGKAWV